MSQAASLISIRDIWKTYRLGTTEVQALRGVHLEIARGEFTALIGTSGSGKTSLLNLIGCLDEPDKGHIQLDNQLLDTMNENQKSELRNRKIGFIFQSFNLIPVLNVFENVEIPLAIRPDLTDLDRRDRIERCLKDVGLTDFKHHLPDQLSGGQRQRVAIARAMVTDPMLILADEPTANLDSKTAHTIIDLMFELNRVRGVTFFFCSHDEKLIGRVGRVIRITDGIIER